MIQISQQRSEKAKVPFMEGFLKKIFIRLRRVLLAPYMRLVAPKHVGS